MGRLVDRLRHGATGVADALALPPRVARGDADPFAGYPGPTYWPTGTEDWPDNLPDDLVVRVVRVASTARPADELEARAIAAAQLAARRALGHPGYIAGRPGGAPLQVRPGDRTAIGGLR